MSSIKLKHSGGNSVSLNPPTSAPTSSDVAFKLPNADGSAGQILKTDGSGNLSFTTDQGGLVKQVLSMSSTTQLYHTGNGNYYDAGLTQAITPSAGTKILVIVSQQVYTGRLNTGGDSNIDIKLFRDSTELAFTQFGRSVNQNNLGWVEVRGTVGFNYLDTHGANGSTAVTYKTQYAGTSSVETYVQRGNSRSTITLLEVAV